MKIVKYDSESDLIKAARIHGLETLVYTNASVSFRVYNGHGNTTEFHVYYYRIEWYEYGTYRHGQKGIELWNIT